MSPQPGADGLVWDKLPPNFLNFDRFHQPGLSLGRSPGQVRTVVPVPRGDHLPLRAAGSSLRAFHWRYLPRRLQDVLIRPSLPACATRPKGVCTHASSGLSRVRRRLFWARIGNPISLATQDVRSFRCCGRNLNFNSADVKISFYMNLKNWSNFCLSCNRCIDYGIGVFTKECENYAGLRSVSHPNGDSSRASRITTNSRRLNLFLQCF